MAQHIEETIKEVKDAQDEAAQCLGAILFYLGRVNRAQAAKKFEEAKDDLYDAWLSWSELKFLVASIGRKIKRKRKESKRWPQR